MKEYIVYYHKNALNNQIFFLSKELRVIDPSEKLLIPQSLQWVQYIKDHNLTLNEIICHIIYRGAIVAKRNIIFDEFVAECKKREIVIITHGSFGKIEKKAPGARGRNIQYQAIKTWNHDFSIGTESPTIALAAKDLGMDQSRISKIARHYLKTKERLYSKGYTFEYIFAGEDNTHEFKTEEI